MEYVKYLAKPARTAGGFFISRMAVESKAPGDRRLDLSNVVLRK